ncbi:MAG: hypothetical protein SGJ20_18425 [Planctomycetota bacterium]|nr:hypothetical protein [Planctomycetota bacterium]
MLRKVVLVSGLGIFALGAGSARADEAILSQYYGSGVHHYFAKDMQAAHADLSQAIDGNTDDPRPYYFRALTYMQLGREPEAEADLAKGAELESNDVNGAYPVGRSLERIQGAPRAKLEKYRTKARVIAYQRQELQRKQRYDAERRLESDRLRVAPLPAGVTDSARSPATPPVPTDDLFEGTEPNFTGGAPSTTPAAAGIPAAVAPATEPPARLPAEDTTPPVDAFGPAAETTPGEGNVFEQPVPTTTPERAPAVATPPAPGMRPAPIAPPTAPGSDALPGHLPPVSSDPFATDAASSTPAEAPVVVTPAPAEVTPAPVVPSPAGDDPFNTPEATIPVPTVTPDEPAAVPASSTEPVLSEPVEPTAPVTTPPAAETPKTDVPAGEGDDPFADPAAAPVDPATAPADALPAASITPPVETTPPATDPPAADPFTAPEGTTTPAATPDVTTPVPVVPADVGDSFGPDTSTSTPAEVAPAATTPVTTSPATVTPAAVTPPATTPVSTPAAVVDPFSTSGDDDPFALDTAAPASSATTPAAAPPATTPPATAPVATPPVAAPPVTTPATPDAPAATETDPLADPFGDANAPQPTPPATVPAAVDDDPFAN